MRDPERLDPVFHALDNPERRLMLERLSRTGARGKTLADLIGRSRPEASRHLRLLRKAGLVRSQWDPVFADTDHWLIRAHLRTVDGWFARLALGDGGGGPEDTAPDPAEAFGALEHPDRRRMIEFLAARPLSATELAGLIGRAPGHVRYHALRLEDRGVIRRPPQGRPRRLLLVHDPLWAAHRWVRRTEQEGNQ